MQALQGLLSGLLVCLCQAVLCHIASTIGQQGSAVPVLHEPEVFWFGLTESYQVLL